MQFTASPTVIRSGEAMGMNEGSGQTLRLVHTFTSPTRNVAVEVSTDDSSFPFPFDISRQYVVTIEEVE